MAPPSTWMIKSNTQTSCSTLSPLSPYQHILLALLIIIPFCPSSLCLTSLFWTPNRTSSLVSLHPLKPPFLHSVPRMIITNQIVSLWLEIPSVASRLPVQSLTTLEAGRLQSHWSLKGGKNSSLPSDLPLD